MADVLALVSARRAQIELEVQELDKFIAWAEDLLRELGAGPTAAVERPSLPPNVVPISAARGLPRRAAKADGTGA